MGIILTVIGLILGIIIAIAVAAITVGLTIIYIVPTPVWVALILFWLYRRRQKKKSRRTQYPAVRYPKYPEYYE